MSAPRKKGITDRDRVANVYGLLALLKDKPCLDCGHKFPPEVMDFDHVRGPKLFTIGSAVSLWVERILAEIEKCELVCSNCHRLRTSRRRREHWVEERRAA